MPFTTIQEHGYAGNPFVLIGPNWKKNLPWKTTKYLSIMNTQKQRSLHQGGQKLLSSHGALEHIIGRELLINIHACTFRTLSCILRRLHTLFTILSFLFSDLQMTGAIQLTAA